MDRLAEARGHGAQMGAAELRNAPALPDGAAQLEEMVAEAIFPVGRILLHDGGVQHGGKQPVDRALGPAGPLLQLVQREGTVRFPEAVQQANGLFNGVNASSAAFHNGLPQARSAPVSERIASRTPPPMASALSETRSQYSRFPRGSTSPDFMPRVTGVPSGRMPRSMPSI